MNYLRIIRMSGNIFAREFEITKKKKPNKYRIVDEKTVAEQFTKGDATVEIIFEESERESIKLDWESDPELIQRYLGARFIK